MPTFSTVPIIQQLKAVDNGKTFKLIGGAAEIPRLLDMENINTSLMPFCGVVPSESMVTDNEGLNGVWQVETNYFDCVVILDNTTNTLDTSGQAATVDFFGTCRDAVFKCILNWNPPFNAPQPISFDGYQLEDLTTSRVVYRLKFRCDINISSDDGYMSPQFPDWTIDPVEVDATIPGQPTHLITK